MRPERRPRVRLGILRDDLERGRGICFYNAEAIDIMHCRRGCSRRDPSIDILAKKPVIVEIAEADLKRDGWARKQSTGAIGTRAKSSAGSTGIAVDRVEAVPRLLN
jgi:hypothetical protein